MIPLRRLADVRAAGDLIWFQGALDRLRTLRHEADPRLRAFFSDGSPVYIARAPGRLDVMGGIADYSGARVLELPLECSTAALLQRQATADCDLATRRAGSWQFFSAELAPLVERDGALSTPAALAAWFAGRESERWASYVVGIVQLCLQRAVREGRGRTPGLRLLIDSTVPAGRGVASSAALEVAAGAAVAARVANDMTATDPAGACQEVENPGAGAARGRSAAHRRRALARLSRQSHGARVGGARWRPTGGDIRRGVPQALRRHHRYRYYSPLRAPLPGAAGHGAPSPRASARGTLRRAARRAGGRAAGGGRAGTSHGRLPQELRRLRPRQRRHGSTRGAGRRRGAGAWTVRRQDHGWRERRHGSRLRSVRSGGAGARRCGPLRSGDRPGDRRLCEVRAGSGGDRSPAARA